MQFSAPVKPKRWLAGSQSVAARVHMLHVCCKICPTSGHNLAALLSGAHAQGQTKTLLEWPTANSC